MTRGYRSRYFWFRALIVTGFLLGIVLLLQTVFTSFYVSRNLTSQIARRDGELKASSIERAIRAARSVDPVELESILDDSLEEWKTQVAWMRVLDVEGRPIAASGPAPDTAVAPDRIPRPGPTPAPQRQTDYEETPAGQAILGIYPLRMAPLGRRPGNAAPASPISPTAGLRPAAVQIALLVDGVAAPFAALRLYLIVGVSAALALMAALVIIALQFPRYVRGQQIESQLELARRVQNDLLPAPDSVSASIDFSAECISAYEVGGDFCDVFKLENDRTAFVLGDVSGKGISAALLMALMHGAIHSTSWTDSSSDHEEASRKLNTLLCEKTANERFATLFWGSFDPSLSRLQYINAGHPPPLIIRRQKDGQHHISRLETGGPVLGLLPNADYVQGEHYIAAGDLLVICSDGVVEATNVAGDEFGEGRLLDTLKECWDMTAFEIRNAIHSRLHTFVGNAPVHDDQTLIVARFQHSPGYGLETPEGDPSHVLVETV